MKAVLIRKYGGPEVLELAEVPPPVPKLDEVVVRVHATSVNPVDWLVRDGGATSFVKVTFPVILGCDLAGEIAAVGANAKRFAVGDPVFAMMPDDWGAHAEQVALAESLVVAKPAKLSMIEAASLPTVAMTALKGLRTKGRLRAGEHVLINGGASAVGMSAIQIAKVLGAGRVVATCSAAGAALAREVGADETIDYKTTDFRLGDARYDVAFDCVGTAPYATCKRVLRGRRVHVTTQPVVKTFLRQFANPLFRVQVFGLITKGNRDDLAYLASLVDAGKLRPIVDKVYPFAEVAAAQEHSKAGRARGKLVLELVPRESQAKR
jgi:NADPH:quinone reductase-like Zn-dependent oxidoreductase